MPRVRELLSRFSRGWLRPDATIAILCAVVIALLWLMTLERMHYERAETIVEAIGNNDNLALAFDEHTSLSLKNIDRVLLLLAYGYARDGLRLDIPSLVKSGLIDDSSFNFIGVVDEQGKRVLGRDVSPPADVPDREYFKVHQQQDNYGMFIGKPLVGRVTGRLSIHMSRRISKPDGSFGGVVFIAVDPGYFTTFYSKARLDEGGMITLVGLDGIARARQTGAVSTSGQDMSGSTLLAESRKSNYGSFRSVGRLEGVIRYFSYRKLSEYPMIVAVASSEAAVLNEFHQRERNYYRIASAGTAIILIFGIGLILVLARQKRTEVLLAGSEQRFRSLIENASDLVVLIDRRGVILFASPSLKRMLGYEVEEVLGRSFLRFIHPEDAPAGLAELSAVARNSSTLVKSERRYLHKNGSWLTLEAIARNELDDPMLRGIIINARDITERRRAEQELEFRNTILSTQQETALDAILVVDADRKIISYNHQFVDLWRIPRELIEAGGNDRVLQSIVDQAEDPEKYLARVKYLYAHKEEKARDELKLQDGRIIDRYSTSMIAGDGHYYGRVWYFRDITEQKSAAERIKRLNMLYATLSGGNSAIVRSTSRPELCQRICDVAAVQGGWAGTWIGFIDKATQRIVPEAWSESMAPYIGGMVVSVDPAVAEGRGVMGIAARSGSPYFCNDAYADEATLPWRQLHEEGGIASIAAIPLRLGEAIVGVAIFYAAQKNFYTSDVQALLLELGGDISFALEMFDRDARREQAEHALVENEEMFRGLVEQTIAGIYIIQDERFVYVNPRFAEILGYEAQELIGREYVQVVDEPYRELVRENIRKRLGGIEKSMQYTFAVRRKDGSLIDIGVHGSRAVFQGRPAVVGIMQDITERKKVEEQEKHHMEQLELAMVATVNAVSAMVEMRDPYTSGHERRVAEVAAAIGTELGLPAEQVKGLRIIGNVHDIGKISAPAEILSKPGRLTPIEFAIIKTHAQQGYDILKGIDFPWPVAQAILQHHERLDGSGYPQGLKGEQILLEARILAVADTVEAMSSHRPYRAGLGIDAALKEIEGQSGKRYCPQAAAACLRLFREKNYQIPD